MWPADLYHWLGILLLCITVVLLVLVIHYTNRQRVRAEGTPKISLIDRFRQLMNRRPSRHLLTGIMVATMSLSLIMMTWGFYLLRVQPIYIIAAQQHDWGLLVASLGLAFAFLLMVSKHGK